MIQEETTTRHRVICDSCGRWALWAASDPEAVNVARFVGWERHEHWNGLARVKTDLCPKCQAEKEGNELLGSPVLDW